MFSIPMVVLALGISFSVAARTGDGDPITFTGRPTGPLATSVADPFQQSWSATTERSTSLRAGGVFRLSNSHGDITITGTTGRMIRIRAVREVMAADRIEAGPLLDALTFSVTEGDSSVEVLTRYPDAAMIRRVTGTDPDPTRFTVTYQVEIPTDVRVSVRSTSGTVTVRAVDRAVDLDTMSGGMSVSDVSGPVMAGSASGDIELIDIGSRIRATCVSGDITIRGEIPPDVEANNTGGTIRWEGEPVEGGVARLSSHSGDIEFITSGETGFAVSLSTISGSISTPLELVLSGETISRRSLRGAYLEPVARVELTAFSGDITIMTGPGSGGGDPEV